MGGPNKFEGRVELCLGGLWGKVCAPSGFLKDEVATVICGDLFGSPQGQMTQQVTQGWLKAPKNWGGSKFHSVISEGAGPPGCTTELHVGTNVLPTIIT